MRARGFTLIELIVTIVIIGILAVTVLPRFANRGDFDARGFYDGTAALLRYGQKAAVAQRRSVCVAFTAASVTLTTAAAFGGACAATLVGPDGNAAVLNAPAGVAFSPVPAAFSFLPSGAATQAQSFAVTGFSGRTLTINAATGYVQQN